jgi:replication initiation and membrane attachment protein DnaB
VFDFEEFSEEMLHGHSLAIIKQYVSDSNFRKNIINIIQKYSLYKTTKGGGIISLIRFDGEGGRTLLHY